jgi:ABA responsive element binding factor
LCGALLEALSHNTKEIQHSRQQTLGEITLEEFLVRAGVVREDAQLDIVKPDSTAAYFGNSAFGYGFGNTNNINNTSNNNSQFSIQSSNLPLNVNGVRSNQSHLSRSQQHQQQQQHQLQILPNY